MIGHIENEVSTEVPRPIMPPNIGDPPVIQPESPAPPLTQQESELLDARAFSHRATGKTYRQIARKLNIPSSSAYKRVQREMKRRREEFAEDEADSRELIVALLDGALEAIATQAYDGDLKAFHLLLQYANTRVRLATIENPKTPDKLIRKINAAAAAVQDVAATEDGAAAQEVEAREEAKQVSLPEYESGPGETTERCEASKSAKGCEQDHAQDHRQGCVQKCGQASHLLAETCVAADEKICAKHVDANQEGIAQSTQTPSHFAPSESAWVPPAECERDCGQKRGQESQPLAETRVAADEKICAKRVDGHNENGPECKGLRCEVTGGENSKTLVTPTGARWIFGCDKANWENQRRCHRRQLSHNRG